MRAGRALRDQQRDDALAPCVDCGHPLACHRELQAEVTALIDGEVIVTPNPGYKPLHFHCISCDCMVVR